MLRFYNLSFAIGTHPDERHMIMVTEKLSTADLNPHSFAYGSFSYYLLWISSRALGHFLPFAITYDGLYIVGRAICALFGLAAVALTYHLAVKLYGDRLLALFAAAFLSFNFFHIQLSRYFTSDVVLTTLCLAALCAMVELTQKNGLLSRLSCGALIGLCVATKISAVFLFLPLMVLLARRLCGDWRRTIWRIAVDAMLIAAVAGVAFVICQPYAVLDSAKFFADLREQTTMVRGLWRPPYTVQYAHTTPYLYHLGQIFHYTVGWPVALASAAGLLVAVLRAFRYRNTAEILLLCWVFVFFFATAGLQVKFPRYLLPIYPGLFVFAALALCPWSRFAKSPTSETGK